MQVYFYCVLYYLLDSIIFCFIFVSGVVLSDLAISHLLLFSAFLLLVSQFSMSLLLRRLLLVIGYRCFCWISFFYHHGKYSFCYLCS